MIKSLVISIAELNEELKDSLIDFFLKLGMVIGTFVGGLTGGIVYLSIIGFVVWLIYTIISLIYDGLGKPGEETMSKSKTLNKLASALGGFWGWLLMMSIVAIITFWLS